MGGMGVVVGVLVLRGGLWLHTTTEPRARTATRGMGAAEAHDNRTVRADSHTVARCGRGTDDSTDSTHTDTVDGAAEQGRVGFLVRGVFVPCGGVCVAPLGVELPGIEPDALPRQYAF